MQKIDLFKLSYIIYIHTLVRITFECIVFMTKSCTKPNIKIIFVYKNPHARLRQGQEIFVDVFVSPRSFIIL